MKIICLLHTYFHAYACISVIRIKYKNKITTQKKNEMPNSIGNTITILRLPKRQCIEIFVQNGNKLQRMVFSCARNPSRNALNGPRNA